MQRTNLRNVICLTELVSATQRGRGQDAAAYERPILGEHSQRLLCLCVCTCVCAHIISYFYSVHMNSK